MAVHAAAETIFHIGAFPVTNAMFNGWIATLFFVGIACIVRGRTTLIPGRLQNACEALLEWLMPYFDLVTESRAKTYAFLPVVGALFVFILFSNWLSLLPGTGSITIIPAVGGHGEAVPLLRPAMSDLNATLALAVFAVIASHLFGIHTSGFFAHLNKYIKLGSFVKSFRQGIKAIFVSFIEIGVGLLETLGEGAKMLSLSLRLFGNVLAGEVLLTVISSLILFAAPIPFIGLELLVGLIQASIFAVLTTVYFTTNTSVEHEMH